LKWSRGLTPPPSEGPLRLFLRGPSVLGLIGSTSIYLYRKPCDMRKSFDALCGIVRSELGADPLGGSLFVFCNRPRGLKEDILSFQTAPFMITELIEESLQCCWRELSPKK